MVTIATFNEPDKAKRLKQRFQEAGIRADIHNEGHLQQMAFMSRPQANAKVTVEDADFERAQNLMIEWETSDPEIASAMIRCPQCGSSNIEYPQMTRKFLLPTLLLHLGIIFRVIVHEAYCESCHWLWSLPRKRVSAPAKARAANAISLE